jgi:ABC-2 type transport system permease protein
MTAFTGTLPLARVALRRDRIQLGLWVVALAAFTALSANAFTELYDSQREIEQTVGILASSPVMRAMGLPSGATIGALVMLRALPIVAILAALMSATAVVRHTRRNEETRRAELIGSTVVGRHAALAAALILVAGANVTLALLVAAALMLNGLDAQGSLAAGTAVGVVGLAFAGVAAITAQVSERSRGATGLAAGVIGVAFLLSAAGNVLGSTSSSGHIVHSAWPAWLSPIGWAQQMRPFGGDHWWILGLFGAWFAATVAIAFALETRRDVGRGMIPERPGPAHAPATLLGPFGLAWRLHRGVLLAWVASITIFGAVFGAVSSAFEDIIAENPEAAEFFARAGGAERLIEGFFATITALAATVIVAYTIPALLRLRAEEADGLIEPILATAVSRVSWLLAHVAVVVLGTLLLLLLMGASAGLLAGIAMDDVPGQLRSLTAAALVHGPAVLLLGGVALAAFGLAPRFAGPLAWAAFALALVGGPIVGGPLDPPRALLNLSPFTHVPAIPAEPFEAAPVVVLLVIAALLGATGFMTFSRRDLVLQAGEDGPRPLALLRLRRRPEEGVAEPLVGS